MGSSYECGLRREEWLPHGIDIDVGIFLLELMDQLTDTEIELSGF